MSIFSDEDFLTLYVTDRPDPRSNDTSVSVRSTTPELSTSHINPSYTPRRPNILPTPTDSLITSSENLIQPSTLSSPQQIVSPQIARDFLKSGPKKTFKTITRIITSTIIKNTPKKYKIKEKKLKKKLNKLFLRLKKLLGS